MLWAVIASARVLDKRVLPATETVAQKLALRTGSPVVRIQRVRLADNTPLSFDETYLPRAIGEKIMENDLENEPIFSLLEQKYNKPLVEAEYRLQAVAADAIIARALEIAAGSPIFCIERTSYCEGHEPIDYEKLYYHGDQIQFVTRLSRRAPRATEERPQMNSGFALWLFAVSLGAARWAECWAWPVGFSLCPSSPSSAISIFIPPSAPALFP